jgi:hypothetical protein
MQWISLYFALFSLIVALIAVGLCRGYAKTVFAMSAQVTGIESRLDQMPTLTPSLLVELAELKESLRRGEELLVKVNRREIANAKARAGNGTFSTVTTKDELRARAGLRAGQVPRHE